MAATAIDQSRLTTFQHHIEDMRNLVVCKICLKPFYEPFILACGHTYCYGCLRNWFNGSDPRPKKKNCPDCRAEVRTQPAPNYLLRDLVHMFISRAELLPEDETVEEHITGKVEEAARLAADRKEKGLFQGVFERGRGGSAFGSTFPPWIARSPLRDEEDDVDRCPVCMWELEEGACGHCGFGYSDEEPDMSDLEDDDSVAGSVGDFHNNGIDSVPSQVHTHHIDLSDEDEAATTGDDYPLYGEPDFSEDEHEMDDFIDDEADEDEVDEIDDDGMGIRPVRPAYQERSHRMQRRTYRIPDEDESEEDDPMRPAGRPSWMEPLERPLGTVAEDEVQSEDEERTIYDESEDDEAEYAVRAFSRRPGPRRHVVIDDDDDEEEEDEEQTQEAEGTGGSEEHGDEDESEDGNLNIAEDTDEEDDDDDGQEFHDAHSETDENTTIHTANVTESEEDRDADQDEDEDQERSDADESIQLTSPPQPSARRTARLDLHRSRRQPARPIFEYAVGPNPSRSRTTGRSYRGSTTVY